MNELPIHDIHLPDAVSWWPLALGWWLLLLVIIACAMGIYYFIKYKKNKKAKLAYKKSALKELNKLNSEYKTLSPIELLRDITLLLRRVTLSYLPRKEVASLMGEQWVKKLNELSNETVFSENDCKLLSNAAYKQSAEFDQENLLNTCKTWVNKLPEASINSSC